ncbi:hypothetical protein BDN70DRAFT_897047 [Pholiota conissans]|uniref:N-acetyltransferase domain-containing protein n=1 Tax=Pholiota conissans TaxID=109636 RepID=A0A9P5YY60_9AGAR|nr:hypothetical protein BDN70DRAFT_897047 [Pholiota conissans]
MSSDAPSDPYPLVKSLDSTSSDAEIKQCATILVEAFKGDPFSSVLLGGDLSLAPTEFDAQLRATLIGGAVHALALGPLVEDLVGVALWYPPGKSVFSSAEERAAGWDQFMDSVPASLKAWWTDYFGPTMGKMSSDALGPDYSLKAWHLHIFGVHPAHQGKGYGRVLFEFAEQQAKETHSNIVLETTTDVDVKIYTRLGFHICGGTEVKSDFGNTHVRLMIKENLS